MRFVDLLRASVQLTAASAVVLAALTAVAIDREADGTLLWFSALWWPAMLAAGLWVGRGGRVSDSIADLLAAARTSTSLPELSPAGTLANRLWPLLLCTLSAGAGSWWVPQTASIGAGLALAWCLGWRHQHRAVAAIEERDAARFYVDRTSPLRGMRLIRTPGFGGHLLPEEAERLG